MSETAERRKMCPLGTCDTCNEIVARERRARCPNRPLLVPAWIGPWLGGVALGIVLGAIIVAAAY